MPAVNELTPLDQLSELTPGTFVAIDVDRGAMVDVTDRFNRLVGSVREHRLGPNTVILDLADDRGRVLIDRSMIVEAWWAPLGYRYTKADREEAEAARAEHDFEARSRDL